MNSSKASLRKKYILKRRKIAQRKKIDFNFNLIFSLIKKHFKNKIIIAGYYPANYEVNVLKFLKEATRRKLKVALPVISSSKSMSYKLWSCKEPLYVSKFGILEPNKSNTQVIPNLILVPLVAFDKSLNRIGYGKGYYDRSLKKIYKSKKNVISLGIAYSFQKCKRIPTNKNDFKLDYIFTERGIITSN